MSSVSSTDRKNYLDYWGKAQPSTDEEPQFHPVAYHCLDVASVGAALLDMRPQLLSALARGSGLPPETVRGWFLFALALHDIGKFACCFQAKVEAHFTHRNRWTDTQLASDIGHGRVGMALWEGGCDTTGTARVQFTPLFNSVDAHCCFDLWMMAVAGHHGRPVEAGDIGNRMCATALDDARAFIEDCAKLFELRPAADTPRLREAAFKRSSWLVAGVTMLCDWIGSNQVWFPYTKPKPSLSEYWQRAKQQARTALKNAGLTPPPVASGYTLADALPGVAHPEATPLQQWAAHEVVVAGQTLAIIEDLTGAGKTEAGLLLAHRIMAFGAAEGLYWALPTMATADALYRRLASSYQRMFTDTGKASLMLAHSASRFNDIFAKSIWEPEAENAPHYGSAADGGDTDTNTTASAACARWLADDRRKTFLADIGVGTVDQALLGVLPSKHQALRLAALSRRVLVIDEAHSYDPYMTKLLETLLEFQGALGGSAIIMSATLTKAVRAKLTAAFAKGAGWGAPKLTKAEFPLATLLTEGQPPVEQPLDPGRGTRRDLPVQRLDDATAAFEVLKAAAADGRAAVWIRNTVLDAVDAHTALSEALPGVPVDLFHARFALGDRLEIEKGVLAHFGKTSEGEQRRRILVATQVVEQSLDCDWDIMISDLAPVDLLIQRAGRLHRHAPKHSPRPAPVLHIVSLEPTPDASDAWYKAAFPQAQWVYQHHGQLWLTMRALLDAGGMRLETQSPRDLIECVFSDDLEKVPEGLAASSVKAEGKAMAERATAGMNGLVLGNGYVHHAGAWESDTRTPTRLGADSRVLRLAKWDGGALTPWWPDDDPRRAWRLSEVSVRANRVASIDYSHDRALARAVEREVERWPEKYDPPLLVVLEEVCGDWQARAKDGGDKAAPLQYDPRRGLIFLSS